MEESLASKNHMRYCMTFLLTALLVAAVGADDGVRGVAGVPYVPSGDKAQCGDLLEYPTTIHSGLTGHCIWMPGSKPHRLIPEIEARIREFVQYPKQERGVNGVP